MNDAKIGCSLKEFKENIGFAANRNHHIIPRRLKRKFEELGHRALLLEHSLTAVSSWSAAKTDEEPTDEEIKTSEKAVAISEQEKRITNGWFGERTADCCVNGRFSGASSQIDSLGWAN